jgi:chemotaxis protein methyltransferase CheR
MIYFPQEVIQATANRFYDTLTDGGWLVIGQAEHSLTTFQRFQSNNFPDTILYRRQGNVFEPLPKPKPVAVIQPLPAGIPAQPPSLPVSKPEEYKPLRASEMVDQACNLLEYGHLEEARDLLIKTVEKDPGYIPACALLGQIYADLGDWPNAELWCLQAIQLDSLALKAYYTLGLVLSHQGKFDMAVKMMKKVIYLDRHHVLGHFHLADLYHANSQIPQALKALDNARRLLENLPDEALVPNSGGVTVERLRGAILLQQQQWNTLSDSLPSESFIRQEIKS